MNVLQEEAHQLTTMLILWELHLFDFRYKFKSQSKTDLEEQIKSPSNDTKPKVKTYYNFRTRQRSQKTFALTRVSQILIVRRESRGKCEKEGIWFGKLCIVLRNIHLCWKIRKNPALMWDPHFLLVFIINTCSRAETFIAWV